MQDAKAPERTAAATSTQSQSIPVHLRKRVIRKANFLDKVRSSQTKKPSRVQKRNHKRRAVPPALADLSSLGAALEAAAGSHKVQAARQGSCQGKGGSRKRLKVTVQETVRLQQVLKHPTYQQNPLAAIQEHLKASLPAPEQGQKQGQKQQHNRRNGSSKRRKPPGDAVMSA